MGFDGCVADGAVFHDFDLNLAGFGRAAIFQAVFVNWEIDFDRRVRLGEFDDIANDDFVRFFQRCGVFNADDDVGALGQVGFVMAFNGEA